MTDFLLQYAIFAAKSITLIIASLLGLMVFISLISSKQKDKESFEVENINDWLSDLEETLEAEMLDKDELKKLRKQRKKKEKQEKKSAKKKDSIHKDRLFIIRFEGDMQASEVEDIRELITAILTTANEKDEVLVILESPGGIVHNYGLAASQLHRIKQKGVTLTVAVDLVAASGGYMMACVADKIIAAPFAVVGSIGVLAQLPNFHRLLNKYDIDIEHHTAGDHKSTLTMLGRNTNKAREKFKEELEETHVLFKEFVKANRSQVDIEKIATGEHWYGTTALELNLIDEIKTSDDYIIERSDSVDIYELSYPIQKTIKDKLSTMIVDKATSILKETLFRLSIFRF